MKEEIIQNNYESLQKAIDAIWIFALNNNVEIEHIELPSTIEIDAVEKYLNNVLKHIANTTNDKYDNKYSEYTMLLKQKQPLLIIVEGKTDAGKTTILKQTIDILDANHNFQKENSIIIPDKMGNRMQKWGDKIASYLYKPNNKSVRVFTMADYADDLNYVINESHEMDVLILGMNTSHKETKALNAKLVTPFRYSKIRVKEVEKQRYNSLLANDIVNRVLSLLNTETK